LNPGRVRDEFNARLLEIRAKFIHLRKQVDVEVLLESTQSDHSEPVLCSKKVLGKVEINFLDVLK
jgi:shikimate kinase